MMSNTDMEIFVKGCSHDEIVAVFQTEFRDLRLESCDLEVQLFCYEAGACRLLVQEEMEDGFTSLVLNDFGRWHSALELARFVARRLHCLVRCEPGAGYPNVSSFSDVFVEIKNDMTEQLVVW